MAFELLPKKIEFFRGGSFIRLPLLSDLKMEELTKPIPKEALEKLSEEARKWADHPIARIIYNDRVQAANQAVEAAKGEPFFREQPGVSASEVSSLEEIGDWASSKLSPVIGMVKDLLSTVLAFKIATKHPEYLMPKQASREILIYLPERERERRSQEMEKAAMVPTVSKMPSWYKYVPFILGGILIYYIAKRR